VYVLVAVDDGGKQTDGRTVVGKRPGNGEMNEKKKKKNLKKEKEKQKKKKKKKKI